MTVIIATSNERRRGDGSGVTGRRQYRTGLQSGAQSPRLSPSTRPSRKAVRAGPSLILPPMGLKLSERNANGQSRFINRHSPYGLPSVRVWPQKATFQTISASGARGMRRVGREEWPNRPLQPLESSFRPVSGIPIPPPAMCLAVPASPPIMLTPLRPAGRAAR